MGDRKKTETTASSEHDLRSLLPAGSYLASRYADQRRQLETRRAYHEDGSVRAFDGAEWWLVCRFSPAQVAEAKRAVLASGLTESADLVDEGVRDAAALTYAWSLAGHQGAVTNWAYPARAHPAFAALEARLNALEDEAGA